MSTPDLDMIKDIPGYKVIMKAILKSQIQQLVEQLATHTEEESVILTASLSDGTLSHLGSDSGKSFLKDHEDVKSQFLGFCLKKHHRKKQEEALLTTPPSPQSFSPRPQMPTTRSTRQSSSPAGAGRGRGARHEPYPVSRIRVARTPGSAPSTSTPSATQSSQGAIKVEPADESSNHSDLESPSSNLTSAPHDSYTSQQQSYEHDSESGGLDAADDASRDASDSGEHSQDLKVESMSGLDPDLEMAGVEQGASSTGAGEQFSESWGQEALGTPGQDSSGATGSMTEMQQYKLLERSAIGEFLVAVWNFATVVEKIIAPPSLQHKAPGTIEEPQDDKPIVIIKTEPIEYDTEQPSMDTTPVVSDQENHSTGARSQFTTVTPDEIATQSVQGPRPAVSDMLPMLVPLHTKKNEWAVNLFEKWCEVFLQSDTNSSFLAMIRAILENSSLLSMTTEELNKVLPVFFMSVQKSKGEKYKDDSLQAIAGGIQRYFKCNNRELDLLKDPSLLKIHTAIALPMSEGCFKGKAPRNGMVLKINKEQESYLWSKGFLGTKSALSLVETMFWMVTIYFGLCRGEDHRKLTFDNFCVVIETANKRYLCFTKTAGKDGLEPESYCVYEDMTNPTQCPVRIFLQYQSRIPVRLRKIGFYFKSTAATDSPWFTNAPLGQNTLGNLIKKLMLRAGFKGNYNNNSPMFRGCHGNKEKVSAKK